MSTLLTLGFFPVSFDTKCWCIHSDMSYIDRSDRSKSFLFYLFFTISEYALLCVFEDAVWLRFYWLNVMINHISKRNLSHKQRLQNA